MDTTGLCTNGVCQAPRCGDGKVEPDEDCDDGDTIPSDGCDADCRASTVVGLAAGLTHTCALLSGGKVRCWGGNELGQLGLGTTESAGDSSPYDLGPIDLAGPAKAIAAGTTHTCALLQDGSVQCWGGNGSGQLGLGHTNAIGDNEIPDTRTVALGSDAASIAAAGDCTCVTLENGTLRCWGNNRFGQLGLGHTETIGDNETPTAANAEISLGTGVQQVAVGGEHTCVVLQNARVRCWGLNSDGQLGLGHTDDIGDDEEPTAQAAEVRFYCDDRTILAIMATRRHSCVRTDDGSPDYWAQCWGYNGDGGLGLGTIQEDPLATPQDWGALSWRTRVLELVGGEGHTCVRLDTRRMRCWGANDKGQLGLPDTEALGDNENMAIADPIGFGVDGSATRLEAVKVAPGERHTRALLNSGEVVCWGYNAQGQLGLGFVSEPPTDFVGGDETHTPALLPRVAVPKAAG